MVKVGAVVPAAGSGSRMGSEIKKQFISIKGIPVLGHVLKVLEASRISSIVVVTGPGEENYCRLNVIEKIGAKKVTAIIPGGKERQDSVYNGLLALSPDTDIVVIHDGVRPLLALEDLEKVIEAAAAYGAAVLAVPVKETVKSAREDLFVSSTIPREGLWLAQTPQSFRYKLIMDAHREARKKNYTGTDDAVLVEMLGEPVKLIQGAYQKNIKITTPEDLVIASALMDEEENRKKGGFKGEGGFRL